MNRTPVADWQQLSALYEQADALEPEALAAWLAELRRQPHPLLAQLEQMLDARLQVRSNGFLGSLPPVPIAPEPPEFDWHPGARVGPYRMLRKLGTGGMAEVWLAERDDGAFQRQVAIKLLFRHTGSRERDTFARRFERERDILASLNHPHIAGLHDAGVTHAGQPWLALEYVEGETLTDWCDARKLTLADRVKLFRQVLMAVQHAHANLVIHRDLKPGNILVSSQGEVRLLDFGIAKLMEPEGGALAETELTRLAGRPMTPQYASPEQLNGQPLTTGSDVYSLGVLLYELLCGERPYELRVDSTAQLEQAILETDPRPPSRRTILEPAALARGTTGVELRRALASDLDAIVLRALAKKPTRRYLSVEAFGADLDRWLEGKPVEARAPSTVYRVRKFVKRHTLAVTMSGGAVVALVAVTVVAVVMGVQAREDSARAVAARDFMLNIFSRANQEKSHGADITARDLLDSGRRDVLSRLGGQPRLQAELLQGIAKIQDEMGEYAAADTTFAELGRTYEAMGQPREQALSQLDRAWNALGMNREDLAKLLLAEVRSAPNRHTQDPEVSAAMAQVAGLLELDGGSAELAHGQLAEARQAAVKDLGENHLRTFALGRTLARADRDTGRIDEALALQEALRKSVRLVVGLGSDENAHLDLDQVSLLFGAGHSERALRLVNEALPRCEESLGAHAQMCRYLGVLRVEILAQMGWVDRALQSLPELRFNVDDTNLPYLQIKALLLESRLQSQAGAKSSTDQADVFHRMEEFAAASDKLRSLRAGAALGLAESCLRTGDWRNAKSWISQASMLMGQNTNDPAASRTGANVLMLLGVALLEEQHAELAIRPLRASVKYLSASAGEAAPATQLASLNLAVALRQSGRVLEALTVADHAQAVLASAMGAEAPTYRRAVALRDRLRENSTDGSHLSTSKADETRDDALADDVGREFFSL